MKRERHNPAVPYCGRRLINIGLLLGLSLWVAPQVGIVRAGQNQAATNDPAVSAFNERVKQYIKLREKVEGELPKLSSKSQPPEIEAHKAALQTNIITARSGAKHGDIFTPDIGDYIRGLT